MIGQTATVADYIVSGVLTIGVPAVVAILWRLSNTVTRLCVRLEMLGERVEKLERLPGRCARCED